MKPKAIHPLAVATAIFVASMSAATAQAGQVSSPSVSTSVNPGVVHWAHLDDLLITTADQHNSADFKTIMYDTKMFLFPVRQS